MKRTWQGCFLLAVACWPAWVPPATAQEPPPLDPLANPALRRVPGAAFDPAQAGESGRRGSPVETLDSLTGEGPERGERDEIETDRDSFTPATTTAGRRRLIVESAYSFIDNRGFKETHSFPELIMRYGLTERVELRLGWNYEVGGAGDETTGIDAGGEEFAGRGIERLSTLSYGLKVRVTDQARWLPRSAAIVQAATPTSGETTASQFTLTYAAGWGFSNRWRFDTAVRYQLASERGDRYNAWAPSAVLKVPVGEKWAVHAEYFGIVSSGKAANFSRHYFSPGLHYLVTPDLEIGFRVGWGLNDQTARFFVNTGFGWRF
jgi:hypothetical protein